MTGPRTYVVFGFASVHDALGGEAVLKAAGVPAAVVPSPKELGEICGIALRVEPAEADAAQRALVRGGASPFARAEMHDL